MATAGAVDAELEKMPREPSYGEMLALAQRHFHAEQGAERGPGRPQLGDDATPGKEVDSQPPVSKDTAKVAAPAGFKTALKKEEKKAKEPAVANKYPPRIAVMYQGKEHQVKDGDMIPRLSLVSIKHHAAMHPDSKAGLYYTIDGSKVIPPPPLTSHHP